MAPNIYTSQLFNYKVQTIKAIQQLLQYLNENIPLTKEILTSITEPVVDAVKQIQDTYGNSEEFSEEFPEEFPEEFSKEFVSEFYVELQLQLKIVGEPCKWYHFNNNKSVIPDNGILHMLIETLCFHSHPENRLIPMHNAPPPTISDFVNWINMLNNKDCAHHPWLGFFHANDFPSEYAELLSAFANALIE